MINVDRCWTLFGAPLSSKFRDLLNLLNCNKYNTKTYFLQFRDFHLGFKHQSINHVFSNPLLGPHFSHFLLICSQTSQLWDSFKIQWAPKWNPNSTKWCKIAGTKLQRCSIFPPRETLKHGETLNGLDIRSFHALRCFAVFSFSGTLLKKSCCFRFLRLRQIHQETPSGSALRNPVGAKTAHKI